MTAILNPIIKGHIKISNPITGEILVDKDNAIHYENISDAMANSIANKSIGHIYKMAFGNGGTSVDSTGVITYLPTNTAGFDSSLYSKTYEKIVDNTSSENLDPTRNYMEVRHVSGAIFSDIFISCLLDYAEPSGQSAFDNSTTMQGEFVFDEIGILNENNKMLTHVIFHPIQKSLNRLIQIDYTLRIQSLTNLTSIL